MADEEGVADDEEGVLLPARPSLSIFGSGRGLATRGDTTRASVSPTCTMFSIFLGGGLLCAVLLF